MRPVQIDAVATYLFLKIACGNRPLHEVFSFGVLNTIDPGTLRVSQAVRDHLATHPASLSLLELASQPTVGASSAGPILAPALNKALRRAELAERDLEIYYNGDSSLTEFRIRCYRRLSASKGGAWASVGEYTPDFLVLHREKSAGAIDACLVVETKGALYAYDPAFKSRRDFASGEFLRLNASRPGIPRFQYLYLEETADWKHQFVDAVKEFFK
ncbi:MAG: hypothetical protein ILM98_08670 [Kiritimatiellae bacterium]|nr:hypothetical protein [Kiritimatiellia bacterium]